MLVIGDLIADEFIYGEVARVSREAPVLILKYDTTEIVAGGAGNAANNVAALGGRARLAGLVGARRRRAAAAGELPPRRRHGARASARASTARRSRRASSPAACTPRKQQVVRIDRDTGWPLDATVSARAGEARSRRALDGCDAVLVSDYGSGLVTPALADAIRRARRAPRAAACRFRCCSTRATRLLDYRGLTACTPNESEVEQALGIRIDDDARRARAGGARCCCGAPGCRRC